MRVLSSARHTRIPCFTRARARSAHTHEPFQPLQRFVQPFACVPFTAHKHCIKLHFFIYVAIEI